MLCSGCKREIENDSEFCEYCGKKVQEDSEKMFCSSCGKPLENGSLFCKHCGASVGSVKKDDKGRKTSYVQKIIIIALVVTVGLLAFGYYKKANPGAPAVVDMGNDGGDVIGNDGGIFGGNIVDNDGGNANETGTNKAKEVNGIYYTIVDNALYLSGEGTVDIKTINSFPKEDFDKVVFESGCIDIPDDAFSGFSNIKSVELRNYVQKIGARAFKGCGFDNIAIGKSVTEIGEDAFADCAISMVFLNNPMIRANLNRRTDFGRLFEFASIIAVFYSSSQVPDDDFTLDESGWGEYLKNNQEYSKIQALGSSGHSVAKRNYNLWANAVRPGFYHFCYTTGLEPNGDGKVIKEYNGETNTFTYSE